MLCLFLCSHELLCDAIDNIVGYSMLLRTTLGMAERGDDGLPDDPSKNDLKPLSQ